MEKYWKHNTKARMHEWFDNHFRKKHYIDTIEKSFGEEKQEE